MSRASAGRATTRSHVLGALTTRIAAAGAAALAAFAGVPAPAAAADPLFVTIEQGGTHHTARSMTLSLDKAAVVRLPRPVADVLVTNPDVVDAVVRTPTRIFLMGMSVGQTNAFFFNADGEQVLNLEIRVERDLAPLEDMLARFLPEARIEIEAINDNVVLKGRAPSPAVADQARQIAARFVGDPEKVLSMIAADGSEQVMLKVRVVEMQRTLAKQLGVDTRAVIETGEFLFTPMTQNPFSLVGRPLGGLLPDPTQGRSMVWDFDPNSPNSAVNASFQAFERAGLARTLAEPNLTAISGESANFLAGGEFPVPVGRDRDGNVTIEFKPFGVGLAFTPVVLSDGRISLKISTEVSELTQDDAFQQEEQLVPLEDGSFGRVRGIQIPSLAVRRAQTTVELPSGGSLMMAGLIQEQTKQNIDGLPGLKDAPILGSLFRSRDFQQNETELVVIVTPYLVKPTSERNLTTPADGFAPASDLETVLFGRLNKIYGTKPAPPGGARLEAPLGFVME
jgi:pilus assembly protein CpaC